MGSTTATTSEHKPYTLAGASDLIALRGHFCALLLQARIHEAEGDDRAGQIRRQIEGEIRALDHRLAELI